MFLGTLGASLSGNLVTGKEVAWLVCSNKQGVMRHLELVRIFDVSSSFK